MALRLEKQATFSKQNTVSKLRFPSLTIHMQLCLWNKIWIIFSAHVGLDCSTVQKVRAEEQSYVGLLCRFIYWLVPSYHT